jgi:hypothetical protein
MSETVRRMARLAVYAMVVIWTFYWIVDGWAYLQQHSIVVQQGFGGDGIQMWEIFDIQMVASHHAVRWLGGVLAAVAGLYLLRSDSARQPRPLATEPS